MIGNDLNLPDQHFRALYSHFRNREKYQFFFTPGYVEPFVYILL
jgi:hypothetical protein